MFANRFMKEGGIWKVREMRLFPRCAASTARAGAKSRLSEPVPSGPLAPDHPVPAADEGSQDTIIPAFHAPNPVTGRKVELPSGKKFVAVTALTKEISAASVGSVSGTEAARLVEDRRRLGMATAYDGTEKRQFRVRTRHRRFSVDRHVKAIRQAWRQGSPVCRLLRRL